MTTIDRRQFVQSSFGVCAGLAASLSGCAAAPPRRGTARILVKLFLKGGNDGINTLVPWRDDGYARHRTRLRLPESELLRVQDDLAFHPSLRGFAELLDRGALAAIQGVGYPEPVLSHFESARVWHTGRMDVTQGRATGWLGRAVDHMQPSLAASVGAGRPARALTGRGTQPLVVSQASDLGLRSELAATPLPFEVGADAAADSLAAHTTSVFHQARSAAGTLAGLRSSSASRGYPKTQLGARLRTVADLVRAELPITAYHVTHGGYDTHAQQLERHAGLLEQLGDALLAFAEDLASDRLGDRVAVLVYSEFGRRVAENASLGTDHGTAGPVFVISPAVTAGVYGTTPSLTNLDRGNLRASIDYRSVYRTMLESWLSVSPELVLPGDLPPALDLF